MFQLKHGVALAALVATAGAAQAQLMQYTYQVNASGQLNGQSFTNTAVTVTLTADPSVPAWPIVFSIGALAQTSLIEVAGIGSDSFSQPINAVSNFVEGYIGLGDPIGDYGIYFLGNPAIVGYMLQAPLGPVSGPVEGNPGVAFATVGGSFTFDSFDSLGTFQATVAQVPEPGTWALMLAGAVWVGRLAQRRLQPV
jgi:hypothetical protein